MNISGSNRRRALVSAIAAGAVALQLSMGAAMAADPVQARKDLKAMGIEYTEQNFAKVVGNGDMTAAQLFIDAGMDVNSQVKLLSSGVVSVRCVSRPLRSFSAKCRGNSVPTSARSCRFST